MCAIWYEREGPSEVILMALFMVLCMGSLFAKIYEGGGIKGVVVLGPVPEIS